MKKKFMEQFKQQKYKVVRVSKTEFELENGDIYPIPFDLDYEPTIEEFQSFIDDSKDSIMELIKKHG